jgi:hypothetical protein
VSVCHKLQLAIDGAFKGRLHEINVTLRPMISVADFLRLTEFTQPVLSHPDSLAFSRARHSLTARGRAYSSANPH